MKWKDFMWVKNHFCPMMGSRYILSDTLQRQFSSCDKPAFAKKESSVVVPAPPCMKLQWFEFVRQETKT